MNKTFFKIFGIASLLFCNVAIAQEATIVDTTPKGKKIDELQSIDSYSKEVRRALLKVRGYLQWEDSLKDSEKNIENYQIWVDEDSGYVTLTLRRKVDPSFKSPYFSFLPGVPFRFLFRKADGAFITIERFKG